MDRDFFRWIWHYPRDVRPRVLALLDEATGQKQVVILRSSQEIERFVQSARRWAQAKGPAGRG